MLQLTKTIEDDKCVVNYINFQHIHTHNTYGMLENNTFIILCKKCAIIKLVIDKIVKRSYNYFVFEAKIKCYVISKVSKCDIDSINIINIPICCLFR